MTCLETHYPPIEVSTPPTQLVVSVEDAKQYCDYEDNDRNGQFERWILSAAAMVEHDAEVALATQTCKLYLPYFPACIEIDKPPVTSITSITYVDGDGTTQTLASTVYQNNLKITPPRIVEAYGQSWPTTRGDTENAVTVTFVAGYDATGSAAPPPWWQIAQEAVLIRVKRAYDGCDGEAIESLAYQGLISALRWRPLL